MTEEERQHRIAQLRQDLKNGEEAKEILKLRVRQSKRKFYALNEELTDLLSHLVHVRYELAQLKGENS
jgi:hypothetical protein